MFITKLVNPLFLLIFDAIILSSVSLEFITLSHLDLISWSLWVFSWISLSRRITHIRRADSEEDQEETRGPSEVSVITLSF